MKNLSTKQKIVIGIIAGVTVALIVILLVIRAKRRKALEQPEIPDYTVGGGSQGGGQNLGTPQPSNTFKNLPMGTFPVKYGDKNKIVYILQRYLNVMHNEALKEDGIYGSNTKAALLKNISTETISRDKAVELIQTANNAGKGAKFADLLTDLNLILSYNK